jgi:hypothetical protein
MERCLISDIRRIACGRSASGSAWFESRWSNRRQLFPVRSRVACSCLPLVCVVICIIVGSTTGSPRPTAIGFRYFDEPTVGRRSPFDRVVVDPLTGDVFAAASNSGDVYQLRGDTLRPIDVYRHRSTSSAESDGSVAATTVLALMPPTSTQSDRLLVQCVVIAGTGAEKSSECDALDIGDEEQDKTGRRIPLVMDVGMATARNGRPFDGNVITLFSGANQMHQRQSSTSLTAGLSTLSARQLTSGSTAGGAAAAFKLPSLSSPAFYVAVSDADWTSGDEYGSVAAAASVSAFRLTVGNQTSPTTNSSATTTANSSSTPSAIRYFCDGPDGIRSTLRLDGSRRGEQRRNVARGSSATNGGNPFDNGGGEELQTGSERRSRRQRRRVGSVRYVYGFEDDADGSIYFLGVRRRNDTGSVETRLSRVCAAGRDPNFRSYAELVLNCRRRSTVATFYNEAVAAFIGPIGSRLKTMMTTSSASNGDRQSSPLSNTALYVVMRSSSRTSMSATVKSSFGLCVYPMNRIRQELTEAQRDCYKGDGRILPWITASEPKCTVNVSVFGNLPFYD